MGPNGRAPGAAIAALIAVVLLVGCHDLTYSDDDAPLQTDRQAYDLQRDEYGHFRVDIPDAYHNTTGRTVYLANCRGSVPPSLQRLDGGEWRTAWSPIELLCLSPPVVVLDGATYRDTLRVFGARPGSNAGPRFHDRDPYGIHRLVWFRAYHNYDRHAETPGTPLPLHDRVSNGFELRAP